MVKLLRGERQYLHLPFWGLSGATPQIQVASITEVRAGTGTWVGMTALPSYTPPADWSAPSGVTGDPEWWGVLLAGPDATSNPVGTIVVTETSRVRSRVVAGDEIDIKPDQHDEWVMLAP